MKALVVYESMFGNTHRIAEAIASGASEGAEVAVTAVGEAPATIPADVDLLIVGGPTHAFSMSRPSSREEAVRRGAAAEDAGLGIREWLSALDRAGQTPRMATFCTRMSMPLMPGTAARSAAKVGAQLGFRVEPPMSFYVTSTEGPLREGELERAQAWGRYLADLSIDTR